MNSTPAHHLQLLGSASISTADGAVLTGRTAQRHRLALLALLATVRGHAWSRDKLMLYLWPESDEERARNLLNVSVYVLRQTLGEAALLSDGDEVRLNPAALEVDVVEFEAALASNDFARATSLYAGPFLDGFFLSDSPEFEKWVDSERDRLAGAHGRALEALAEAAEQQRDFATAVAWWKRRAAQDPHDSRVALRLIEALGAEGNPAGALQYASIHRNLLQEEFSLEPPPEWIAAVEAIRARPAPRAARPSPPVSETPVGVPARAAPPARRRRAVLAARYAAAAALVAAIIFAAMRIRSEPSAASATASEPTSLAVLPLLNLSGDARDAPLADGMTEELIGILSRTGNLRVIASTSVFRFRNRQTDVRAIGDSLRVANVLEGGFQKIGSRLRVQMRLVDAKDGSTRWSQTYDRELQDVFAVQDDIARSVARELDLQLSGGKAVAMPRSARTNNVAAYELYLRGSDMTLLRSDSGARAALAYFKQAIALDSTYAAAYAGLARLYIRNPDLPRRDLYRLAREAAHKAVALDDSLAEAHVSKAAVHLLVSDFASGERELNRAIALEPYNERAHQFLVRLYVWTGRPKEALEIAQRTVQNDPLSPTAHSEVAYALLSNGRCDEALKTLEPLADLRPPLLRAVGLKAVCQAQLGRWPEAIATLESLPNSSRGGSGLHAYMLARGGQRERALAVRDSLQAGWQRGDLEAFDLVVAYLGLRDYDQTLIWLDRAVTDGSANWTNAWRLESVLEELRGDPRFERFRGILPQKR